jgi:hypothetical protein
MARLLYDGITEAVELVIEILGKRNNPAEVVEFVNDRKHCVINSKTGLTYYILFKRSFFGSFGKIFENEGAKGIGESINRSALEASINFGAHLILCVYPDGKIYSLTPREWKESRYIRKTDDTGEETVSISASILRRWM